MIKISLPVSRGLRYGLLAACLVLPGCFSSSSPTTSSGTTDESSASGSTGSPGGTSAEEAPAQRQYWEEFPDVPYVPIMTEIDGIEIPRQDTDTESAILDGEVPVDLGNEHAKANPSEPTTGDWLVVRFNSEPESLNPITETSAVQSYMSQYVQEALAWQDPETFEYGPHIASRWEIEDSVKLAPNYPGHERQLVLLAKTEASTDPQPPNDTGGEPAEEITFEYTDTDGEEIVWLRAIDADGEPAAGTWVGIRPEGDIDGAKALTHAYSNADGYVSVSGLPVGEYRATPGVEIYGVAEETDGGLKVTPKTEENPLSEQLASADDESLMLEEGQWQDIQRQTVFTYYLRDDVTWSDGEPFTSKDLEFGYAVINNMYVDGDSLRIYYQDLIECRGLSDHVVRMKYREQYFKAFEFTAGLSAYSPPYHKFAEWIKADGKELTFERLSEEEEEQQNKLSVHGSAFARFYNTDNRYNESPLGTGPYTVGTWRRDDRVELNRRDDYWHEERAGHLDKLVFKFIIDNVTALQALRSGEIDFLYRMDAEQYFDDLAGPPDWFKDRYVKAEWFSPSMSYIGWNLNRELFQDRRVRVALACLFDKQDFLEKKLHGAGKVISGSEYYFGPGYDHNVPPIGYDPQVARELLADAGWVDTDNNGVLDRDGVEFRFTMQFPPGNPIAQDRAAIFQRNLKDVGIVMEIENLEWASFIERVRSKDFDCVSLGWAMSLESDPYQIWHSSGAGEDSRGSNHVSFADPLADELIEMVRVTLDEEKRKRIYWSLHHLLDREQPYMFLYVAKEFGAYHQRFRGVKWYALRPGFDFREWYVPKDEQVH